MIKQSILLGGLVILSGLIQAQEFSCEPSPNVWEHWSYPGYSMNEDELHSAFMNSIGIVKDQKNTSMWEWECVGPNVIPEELNPGGRSIPNYAINRGNGTGRINFILIDENVPNRVFACSPTGGIWVSNNGGDSWESAGTDNLPISGVASITVDHKNHDRWIMVTGDGDDNFMFSDGVWRTEDAGESWQKISKAGGKGIPTSETPWEYTRASKILAHPRDFSKVFLCTNKGLFVSKNADKPANRVCWKKVAESNFYDVEIMPWNPKVIIASGEHLFISTDTGKNWKQMPDPDFPDKGENKFIRINVELNGQDPDNLYCAVTSRKSWDERVLGEGTFQKFNLNTREWTEVRSLKSKMNNVIPSRARAFTVSPTDQNVLLCANVQPIYRSTDGGLNFDKVGKNQMHDDVHHIQFAPDGKTVWAGNDGGVAVSYDGGVTWENKAVGIGAANVFGHSVAQQEEIQVIYGAYDTGGNLLRNGKWYHTNFGDGFQTITHPQDPDIMFATRQSGGIVRSIDGEDFEKSVSTGKTKSEWHTWLRMNDVYPNTIYLAGTNVMRSTNLGEEWESILDVAKLFPNLKTGYRLFLSPNHPEVIYLYALHKDNGKHAFLRTFNANVDNPDNVVWEEVPEVPKGGWFSGLAIDPDNPKQFWTSYTSFEPTEKVYRFNGEKYIDISANLGYAIVDAMIIDKRDEERLYLGTNHGVYTRSKSEQTWTLLQGLPGTFIRSLDINYVTEKLLVGTYGRGIWQGDLYQAP